MAVNLLHNLGFFINREKSIVIPTNKIEYLGSSWIQRKCSYLFCSTKSGILRQIIRTSSKRSKQQPQNWRRSLAKCLQRSEQYCQLPCSTDTYRDWKPKPEGCQSYETVVHLTPECKAELQWWLNSILRWNGKSVLRPSPDLVIVITSDACLNGWGAHCNGVNTQGLWTQEEQQRHINTLELKAVFFAVKAFIKTYQKVPVHLKFDNSTTVSYISKMGGTRYFNLIQITKELWDYWLQKEITITAEHLPGHMNQQADQQSREYKNSSNWRLNPKIFFQIMT